MSARQLSDDEKETAYAMAIEGKPYYKISDVLGFRNKMQFHRYCIKDPAFSTELQSARIAAGVHFEDEIIAIADNYFDPQQARVKLECLKTAMGFINPVKYGMKFDINLNTTVSLLNALDGAEQRVLIDVTPKLNDSDDITL